MILRLTILFLTICLFIQTAKAQEASSSAPVKQTAVSSSGHFSTDFPSISPGLPVPMDLKEQENIKFLELHTTIALRQNEAFLMYSCVVDWNGDKAKTPISIGVPLNYNLLQPQQQTLAPVHRLPLSKAINDIQVGSNGILMKHNIQEGVHPQIDAPSLQASRTANCWLIGNMQLKPGKNVISFHFSIPLRQSISGKSGRQAQTSISSNTLDIITGTLLSWGGDLQVADVDIYCEEMLFSEVKIDNTGEPLNVAKTEKGVLQINLLQHVGKTGIPEKVSIHSGANCQYTLNAEDLPDRIGSLSSLTINGKRAQFVSDYSITASSTLPEAINGRSSSPENLKNGPGFWAENAPGDGQGESLTISLSNPKKLKGFVIQAGASPMILGRNDPEALRHPDVAFSLNSRPKVLSVSLNDGEYTFKATLRDDWNPQLIEVPYFNKSIKTAKITLEDVYQGTANDHTYMTTLLPVSN